MSGKSFVDTNVLIYAHDVGAGGKHGVAKNLVKSLWEDGQGMLSSQVLNEFASVLLAKGKLTHERVLAEIEPYLSVWPVVSGNAELLRKALRLARSQQFAFWDSLIVQAALEGECRYLYTEDMSHRRRVGTLTILNPFAMEPSPPIR